MKAEIKALRVAVYAERDKAKARYDAKVAAIRVAALKEGEAVAAELKKTNDAVARFETMIATLSGTAPVAIAAATTAVVAATGKKRGPKSKAEKAAEAALQASAVVVPARKKRGPKSKVEKAAEALALAAAAAKPARKKPGPKSKAEKEAEALAASAAPAVKPTPTGKKRGPKSKAEKAAELLANAAVVPPAAPKKKSTSARAEDGRRAVSSGERPPIKEAIAKVLGNKVMSGDDIYAGLIERNWLPNSKEPRKYVGYLLSSTKDRFEAVKTAGRGMYRVIGSGATVSNSNGAKTKTKAEPAEVAGVSEPETASAASGASDSATEGDILADLGGMFESTSASL